MSFHHKTLAEGRWQQLSLMEQMANIGSEVHRSINWYNKNEPKLFEKAFERALELFDLTLADIRWKQRLKEIARSREVFCGLFFSNELTPIIIGNELDKYFMQFAVAVRNQTISKTQKS